MPDLQIRIEILDPAFYRAVAYQWQRGRGRGVCGRSVALR